MLRLLPFCAAAAADRAEDWARLAHEPFPPLPRLTADPPVEVLNFVSATLGDHMVLQRAPQAAVVWGHTTPGATVTTKAQFLQTPLTATADVNGTWRQKLPPQQASKTAYTLSFSSSTGEKGQLSDVLFGDVYICGGQSNMQFAIPATENASAEEKMADNFPTIRLFTIGQKNSSHSPFHDLQYIEQGWSVANETTIQGNGGFGYFSSVCWFFGREISTQLSPAGDVPVGLISNNWGGTPVEHWSTPEAFAMCNRTFNDGTLYYSMISPYTVGPMAVSGFTWYQGEANTKSQQSADDYACLFPAMISEWRRTFANPDAYFGYIQLSTWCPGAPLAVPEMREAQQAALRLPKVGYATNADHGAACNIHPPPKQYCGKRLGDSALALHYGKKVAWKSPSYGSASAAAALRSASGAASVTVTLQDVGSGGLSTDTYPYNYVRGLNCTAQNAQTPGTCAWAAVEVGGQWLNATVAPGRGAQLVLTAQVPEALAGAAPTASAYAWGPIPLMNAYDKTTGLPVLGWNRTI